MKALLNKKIIFVSALLIVAAVVFTFSTSHPRVDFNTEVKPIFNKKCISCHGGVKSKANFSLLFRSEALAPTESGRPAIIPGKPEESELIRRITHSDPEERMPYKHAALEKHEIEILRNWIKQGAEWGDHWAYLPVKKVTVPDIESDWYKNDIDRFIFTKLKEKQLKPSAPAEKSVILRRAALDIIGMLPDSALAANFLRDSSAASYDRLIDSLLASPHYGERWATLWLDLARYADTKGYESDYGRNIWKYRDWVIKAYNDDMPYDKFLTEQIAGDLLPNPTDAQYIATAFHRNAMSNDEGGTDNEEFRTSSVIDRVNTTWEGIMGTTFACVQCHSHPYDPFRHEEYYSFMAYFNNTRDEDVPDEYPMLRDFNDSLTSKLNELTDWVKQNSNDSAANAIRQFVRTWQPSINSTAVDNISNNIIENNNYALLFHNNSIARIRGVKMDRSDKLIMRFATWKDAGVLQFRLDSANGRLLKTYPVNSFKGNKIVEIDYPVVDGVHDVYMSYTNRLLKDSIEYGIMFNWFYFTREFPAQQAPGYAKMKKQYWDLITAYLPGTPIMMENPEEWQRKTNVFERGNWMAKGKEVQPGVPQSLQYALPKDAPANRLGLAMWLTNKQNPLVARTLVNRLWEQLFGTGIAETLEDLGTQGIAPTHVELLDHLSWKLMNEYNWSMKKLVRELVTSATYRQSSKVSEENKQKDLFNKYYARGPRIRLTSEQLRDQHLGICGQLNEQLYGKSVMPWQPDGIWLSPYNGSKWNANKDAGQYRRALYTYWKRSSPYPSMIAFDGSQRVVCNARRIRTNTPLQALVTLNDSAYLDMARHFAYRMKADGGADIAKQIAKGYERMMFKAITNEKLNVFTNLYAKALEDFKKNPERTCEMIGIMNEHNNASSAALVVVANAMLNMDEVITKN
ncbi:MAG: DUF1553 domain-containing protein [Chitinophagaceae bacterium]|nr:DUF1553 domain-containing protein [Chitinophagaceae bacterium]